MRTRKRRIADTLTVPIVAALLAISACQSAPGLSGAWVMDRERSTNIDSWRTVELHITASESEVSIGRLFNPNRYTRHDSVTFPVDNTPVTLPIEASAKWLDQPHLGVFHDGTDPQEVRAQWVTPGKELSVQHNLTLQTSQGEADVEIRRTYTLSDDGSELTLSEIRNTRPGTLNYVFTRK